MHLTLLGAVEMKPNEHALFAWWPLVNASDSLVQFYKPCPITGSLLR